MAPNRKKNRKKTSKKSTTSHSRLKAVAPLAILVALGGFGIWQCFGEDAGSPLAPAEAPQPRKIDVGEGNTPDPTLINEATLLENENKQEQPEPKAAPPQNPPEAPKEESEEQLSIEEAGEEIAAPTEEEKLENDFPLYAVAYHFHTQVKEEANMDSRVIAYARRGSEFRVSKRVSTKGCPKGWHETTGGGYICDGKGFNVSTKPVTFAPAPPKPKLDAPLPYQYKYAKVDDTAEYWKLPSAEEVTHAKTVFARITQKNLAAVEQSPDNPSPDTEDKEALAKVLENAKKYEYPNPDTDTSTDNNVSQSAPQEHVITDQPKEGQSPSTADTDSNQSPQEDPYALPPYVHLRMAKGYYVSVDDVLQHEGTQYQRTVRGRYVKSDQLYNAKPSSLEGVLLNSQNQLPLVVVVGGGVKTLKQEKENGPFKNGAKVSRYERFPFLGTMTRRGKKYVRIGENTYLSSRVAAVIEKVDAPEHIGEGERWIDVNLSEQTLVAYEGDTPVFATIISSGRKEFATPEGEFRIYGKHISITMDNPDGGDEAYSIEDVPWTQYFEEGYALHAAFWHDRFGRVRSHGCINLSPADARRLFFWTGPHVASGMHGAIATKENPGTRVIIRKQ